MALLTQCIYAYRIRVVAKLTFLSWCIIVVCRLQIMHCSQLHMDTDDCFGTYCHRDHDSGGIFHGRIFCASNTCEWCDVSSIHIHLSWGLLQIWSSISLLTDMIIAGTLTWSVSIRSYRQLGYLHILYFISS